jgi:hypothetical protein
MPGGMEAWQGLTVCEIRDRIDHLSDVWGEDEVLLAEVEVRVCGTPDRVVGCVSVGPA